MTLNGKNKSKTLDLEIHIEYISHIMLEVQIMINQQYRLWLFLFFISKKLCLLSTPISFM